MAVVVDTNVPMVASGFAHQADDRCVDKCIQRLAAVMQVGGLLVDDGGLILNEYTRNIGFGGQPGVGHAFVKWAHNHQAIPSQVQRVTITPTTVRGWRRFEEFPDQNDLHAFDPSDQKFVAVALASGQNPSILNAVDSDWWNHRVSLTQAGVSVEFLCPQEMQRLAGDH